MLNVEFTLNVLSLTFRLGASASWYLLRSRHRRRSNSRFRNSGKRLFIIMHRFGTAINMEPEKEMKGVKTPVRPMNPIY
jgi:hypothetical protein